VVPVIEHRTDTDTNICGKTLSLLLPGAAFHHQQISTGRVALMRPFLILTPATLELGPHPIGHTKSNARGGPQGLVDTAKVVVGHVQADRCGVMGVL
jgi:hypothetical protein